MKTIPVVGRVPISYLVQFVVPDSRTDETETVVVPQKRTGRSIIFVVDDGGPVSPKNGVTCMDPYELLHTNEDDTNITST